MNTLSKNIRFRKFLALPKLGTLFLFSFFALFLVPSAFAAAPTFSQTLITIDYNNGALAIPGTDFVTILDVGKFHLNNVGRVVPADITLTSCSIASTTLINCTLTEAERAEAIALSGTPGGDGVSIIVDIDGGAVEDAFNTPNIIDHNISVTETADTTPPILNSVVWNDIDGNGTISGTDTLSLTFSETMNTSTLTTANILDGRLNLSNSHTFGNVGMSVSWNAARLIATITLGSDSTVANGDTIDPSALVTDLAGNADATMSPLSIVAPDTVAPTMDSAETKTTTTIDVTFSEDLDATTITTGDFSVAGNTVSGITENAGVVTLTLGTPIATDATPLVTMVSGQTIDDTAGNTMTSDGGASYQQTPADGIAPTVLSVASDGAVYNADIAPITITFSEDVTSPSVSVAPDNGVMGTGPCPDSDASTWCFGYTVPATTEATETLTISASADLSANTMVSDSSHTFGVDTIAPTVAISYSANPAKAGTVTITATYSEPINGPVSVSINQPGTTDLGATAMSGPVGTSWSYDYTVVTDNGSTYQDGTATVSLNSVTDTAGNTAAAPTGNTFTIDTIPSTIAITSPGDTQPINAASTFTFTSSEPGTQECNINGGAWEVCASGDAFSTLSDFAALGEGAFTLNVRDTDSAGNIGTDSTSPVKDTVAPTYTVAATSVHADGDTIVLTFNEAMETTTITSALLQADTNITLDYSDDAGNTNEANIPVTNATVAWTGSTIATITLDEATDGAYIPDGKFIGVTLASVSDIAGNNASGTEIYTAVGITAETTAPDVTKLGDGTTDFVITSPLFDNLIFDEILSPATKTAIESAITAGADNAPAGYSWSTVGLVSGERLTISAHATLDTTFANDVTADVTDLAGNTATALLLIDSAPSAGGGGSNNRICRKPYAFDFSPQENVSELKSFSFFVAPELLMSIWKLSDWVKEELTITVDGKAISKENVTVSLISTEDITDSLVDQYTSKVEVILPSPISNPSEVSILVSADGNLGTSSCRMNQDFTVNITPPSQVLSLGNETSPASTSSTEKQTKIKKFANIVPHNFKDVFSRSWEYPFVEKVSSAGIMTGYADGSELFGKDDAVTNAQLIKVGLESFGFDIPNTVASKPFQDVPTDEWFAPYVLKAKEIGITPRILNGKINPNQSISRGETLRLLLSFAGIDLSEVSTQSYFPDVSPIQDFTKSIVWATENGIVNGYENGKFGPHDSLTRGQLAKIVVNLIEFLEAQ